MSWKPSQSGQRSLNLIWIQQLLKKWLYVLRGGGSRSGNFGRGDSTVEIPNYMSRVRRVLLYPSTTTTNQLPCWQRSRKLTCQPHTWCEDAPCEFGRVTPEESARGHLDRAALHALVCKFQGSLVCFLLNSTLPFESARGRKICLMRRKLQKRVRFSKLSVLRNGHTRGSQMKDRVAGARASQAFESDQDESARAVVEEELIKLGADDRK